MTNGWQMPWQGPKQTGRRSRITGQAQSCARSPRYFGTDSSTVAPTSWGPQSSEGTSGVPLSPLPRQYLT